MKTRLLIPAILLTTMLSSFQQRRGITENITSNQTTIVEGLFGEEDCAPGVIWFLTRNGKDLDEQPPYVFHFCPDHSLVAVGDKGEIRGSWYKDAETNTVQISISGPHYIFELVSGNWQIVEHSENALELTSSESGELRQVRFERLQR